MAATREAASPLETEPIKPAQATHLSLDVDDWDLVRNGSPGDSKPRSERLSRASTHESVERKLELAVLVDMATDD